MLLHQVRPPHTWARMPRLLIVVALALPSLARAATWNLDPAHTSVQFSVRHLMVSTVRGAFGKLSGTVQVEEKDLTRSKILGAYFAAQTAEDLAIESVGKKTVKAAWNQSWLSWIF